VKIASKVDFLNPIDVDKVTVERDYYFPNAYVIDLPLNAPPDHAWQDIFERECRVSTQFWERKIFVMGDKLRLVTTENEIEDKLGWIKKVVEQTNRKIDEYNRTFRVEKELCKKIPEEDAKECIERIRETLKQVLRTY